MHSTTMLSPDQSRRAWKDDFPSAMPAGMPIAAAPSVIARDQQKVMPRSPGTADHRHAGVVLNCLMASAAPVVNVAASTSSGVATQAIHMHAMHAASQTVRIDRHARFTTRFY